MVEGATFSSISWAQDQAFLLRNYAFMLKPSPIPSLAKKSSIGHNPARESQLSAGQHSKEDQSS
jgi:hypothetical protein